MNLENEALHFAERLSSLLNETICDTADLNVEILDSSNVWVSTGLSTRDKEPTPLVLGPQLKGDPVLGIQVEFRLTADRTGKYLSVDTSKVALAFRSSNFRPIIRLEFERNRGSEPGDVSDRKHSRHAAHVQIHGESSDLAYVWALNGRREKLRLENLHIPVGGRRYRPSVEDFIEFLLLENLVTDLKPNGIEALEISRQAWLELQLKSAVKNNPEAAISQLKSMGLI